MFHNKFRIKLKNLYFDPKNTYNVTKKIKLQQKNRNTNIGKIQKQKFLQNCKTQKQQQQKTLIMTHPKFSNCDKTKKVPKL